jgi:hypothetical protein
LKKIEVSDRSRIKQEIVDRYHAEAGRQPPSCAANKKCECVLDG